jgi:glycosyltransferase involved in cell wall biosynthesis
VILSIMRAVGVYSLDVKELPDGKVELTKKFVDGMHEIAKGWPGELVAVMAPRSQPDSNLDHGAYRRDDLPFELVVCDARDPAMLDVLRGSAVVVLGADYRHVTTAKMCRDLEVPYVVVAEYNLKTRLQIAEAEEPRFDRRMRRMVWELAQEARARSMIAEAAGVQCNGTPTFEGWGKLNRDPLLYFDTRVTPAMLASDDDVKRRATGDVLRLAFSGRLIAMKGVLHLVDVAAHLREQGVKFALSIFGGGALEGLLRERIAAERLDDVVHLEGVLPFDELMTKMRSSIDLFVCPHVQGDPSCTYLETISCGVPIAGFDNDAWRGLVERSEGGWLAPLGDTHALANVIARVNRERDRIRATAASALRFARLHTFNATFARRTEHMRRIAGI